MLKKFARWLFIKTHRTELGQVGASIRQNTRAGLKEARWAIAEGEMKTLEKLNLFL